MTTITRPRPTRTSIGGIRALPSRADIPAWIRYLALAAALLVVITAVFLGTDAGSTRTAVEVIGQRTAPTVTATEDLYFALADMDAQLANVLLAGDDSVLAATRAAALTGYEHRRVQADADLQQAMTIATGDDAALRIRELLDRFGQYEALAAETMQLSDLDRGPAGQPSARTLEDYRSASGLVPDLLARAQKLADSNSGVLESSYSTAEHTTVAARIRLAVLGALLLGTLIGLQILLRVTMHRRLNPALIVATALGTALLIGGFAGNSTAAQQLTIAKKDAFDSLLALRQARAVGYSANADESRYLLDPEHAAEHQQAFLTASQRLAGVPVHSVFDYDAGLDTALTAYRTTGEVNLSADSFLGKELRNITFAGERDTAVGTLNAYQVYQRDDRRIRELARTDLPAAIALCTGSSNEHFTAYDNALVATIDINQRAFDASIGETESALAGWNNWLPLAGTAAILSLILLGVRPRLAEYR
ncbi:hypothetical protein GFY24_37655 [Nocardia sp. SYP-A9097]|uniref:hypothetical protein n=1 Tax=Nocardia sp. SYP-A9097 TaxID=2663237 RepID=UPI00129A4A05|nr:hypothetical protein [Nocardia sp. SYP-A9097]MRH93084.1 hypothetical protein [Nocardia sp. SYP-A9097]